MTVVEQMRDMRGRLRTSAPLYAELMGAAADDAEAGGITAAVLAGYEDAPETDAVALRLLGAVHRIVLRRRAPELATFYRSVGGTGDPASAWPAFERVLAAHTAEVTAGMSGPPQTNEVGRSAVLYGGLLHLGDRPLRLLEIGASAGLNLNVDRFAYEVGDQVLGDPGSPVRLVQPWAAGPQPPAGPVPRIVSRRGCDVAPVDPATAEGRLTLTSYVWPDHVERFERLRGALDVAARHPVTVDRSDARSWLARQLALPAESGVGTVVWQSVLRQYLPTGDSAALSDLLAAAGDRATPESPLAHLALEPVRSGDQQLFGVGLRVWPGGRERQLGTADGHGPPVAWSAG